MSRLASPTHVQQHSRRDRRLLTSALALALVALPMGVRDDAPLPGWQTALAKNDNGKGGGPGGGKGNGRGNGRDKAHGIDTASAMVVHGQHRSRPLVELGRDRSLTRTYRACRR